MPEQPKKSRSLIPLYIVITLFYLVTTFQEDENRVLLESVSQESDFQANLTESATYKFWIDNPNGPEKVNVTISKDSYVALQNTFVLTNPEKSYYPDNPEFTVKKSGIYNVHIRPLNPGTVYIEIEKLGS